MVRNGTPFHCNDRFDIGICSDEPWLHEVNITSEVNPILTLKYEIDGCLKGMSVTFLLRYNVYTVSLFQFILQ